MSCLAVAFETAFDAGVDSLAAGLAAAFVAGLAATGCALATGLTAGLTACLVEEVEADLAACLDGGDAFVTDFIASLTTGLALVAGATLALDVETLAGAADLLPDLVTATGESLGVGLDAARTGLVLVAGFAGLAATADLVTVFLVLAVELPFFTDADCLALAELFLGVACLPEDLVMMV